MKQNFVTRIQKMVFLLLGALLMFGFSGNFADDPDQIPEIGLVKWSFDLESAKQQSANSGRPVFLLFQEIPG